MDKETKAILDIQMDKILALEEDSKKAKKKINAAFWITIITIVVPAIILLILIPFFLNSYIGGINEAME